MGRGGARCSIGTATTDLRSGLVIGSASSLLRSTPGSVTSGRKYVKGRAFAAPGILHRKPIARLAKVALARGRSLPASERKNRPRLAWQAPWRFPSVSADSKPVWLPEHGY